uniref:Secreted protein n=1 Tax=Setaria viridis TaxID=4556 RepID=A0A4U6VZC7_SETVI|nr:hypothetical protein SEVIR_2G370800v2 [Setaria viridis]
MQTLALVVLLLASDLGSKGERSSTRWKCIFDFSSSSSFALVSWGRSCGVCFSAEDGLFLRMFSFQPRLSNFRRIQHVLLGCLPVLDQQFSLQWLSNFRRIQHVLLGCLPVLDQQFSLRCVCCLTYLWLKDTVLGFYFRS